MNFWSNIMTTALTVVALIFLSAVVYYIVSYRNLKQRRKHFEELHRNLKPGQKVEFSNGLRGTVRYVTDEECDIEVKSGAVITVSRYAVSQLLRD